MVTPEQLAEARRALGQRLAALREAASLTQAQLARLTGYTRSAIANIETGRSSQPRTCWVRYDQLLRADGVLLAAYDHYATLTEQRQRQAELHRPDRPPTLAQLQSRDRIGDPTDLTRQPATTAITTLIIRNAHNGVARFLVHWRDPAKVATNLGMYQLAPVGMFQPASSGADRRLIDLDLWRCMAWEYSEELLGAPEHDDPDYGRWPFFIDLEGARRDGACRPYRLGIGVGPLTLATDLLTAVVFDSAAFDRIFAKLVTDNAEGRLDVTGADGLLGTPFTDVEVRRLTDLGGMQAAGAATLRLAWRHRRALIGS